MSLEHTLTKLVSYNTTTGNRKEVLALYDWVKKELQPVPLYIREYDVKEFPTLIVTPGRSKQAKLWLAAHVDVVPAPETMFLAQKRGNKLYGRGVYDMKFALACYLTLLKEIGVDMKDYSIGLMLTSDEEWGGHNGVKHMLEREKYRGDLAFLPDGTGTWKFEESAKGKWLIKVRTTGVATHGSRPWDGRSATAELCAFLSDLVTAFKKLEKGNKHWHPTVNVGTMSGGESSNVVAPGAKAVLDIRYTSNTDKKAIQHIFTTLKKKYSHTKTKTIHNDSPYGIPRTNGFAKHFARIVKEQCSISCGWAKAHGASDARFFNETGIPTILISPNGGGAHSDKEWIDVKDLERYYRVLKQFVEEVAKK